MTGMGSSTARKETGRPTLVGVLYAEDFDDEAKPPVEHEEPPEPELIEPMFTGVELDAARAEAKLAGRAEAERGIIASRVQLLSLIATSMTEAQDGARAAAEHTAEAVARCMLTALTACLPALCERHGAGELRALARAVLPALTDEPRITVRIHPHMVAVLEEELATLDFEIAERVHLVATDAIAPGDARINWAEGSAVRDAARARSAVHDALAALGLHERTPLQPEMTDA